MPGHKVAFDLFRSPPAVDPGASGTITVDRSPMRIELVSATTETRTLDRPTRSGLELLLFMKTDGGDITLTVTGGYNEDGDTTFTFDDAGEFAKFSSCYDGSSYFWRLTSSHALGQLTQSEAAFLEDVTAGTTEASKAWVSGSTGAITVTAATTPTAVATTPGTAQSTQIAATGGIGGGTTISTTGTGGVGGGFSFTAGAGGVASAAATAATGGAGGAIALTGGAGGAEAVAGTDSTGGAGGAFTFTTGAGGAVSAAVSGTATGGASGAVTIVSGVGGAVTATSGTNVGGASGAVIVGSGVGGAASGATDTGGASGAVTIRTGTGGAGDTGGASGVLTLQTGAAGAGGSPTVGHIAFSPGAAEKWRIEAAGNMTSVAGTPANAATTDGAILATGGIAFTDVANAWIDDATQGNGTVQHFIGNETIDTTAPSDRRLKRNIEPTQVVALPLLLDLKLVDFNWRAEDADPARQFGFIAQQFEEVLPGLIQQSEATAGFKYVKKHELVPYLVKAIQELAEQVKDLKQQLRRE